MIWDARTKGPQRVAVFGLGRFGYGLAVRLAETGVDVLAVDSEEDLVEEIDQRVSRAICLDATSEFALNKLDVDKIDLAIVCIGRNISAGLLITAALQLAGLKEIWVRAIDRNQGRILESMGVTRIINLENEMARIVAHDIALPTAKIIAPLTDHHSLAEVQTRDEFVGKTLQELDFRNHCGLNIVAIKSPAPDDPDAPMIVNDLPHADDIIREGDVLVVIGTDEKLAEFQAEY